MRTKLADRRESLTIKVVHTLSNGDSLECFVTAGLDHEGTIREVFCADPRIGSDIHALLTDGCILISIYLQTGGEVERLVRSLGENRSEKEISGPPSSVFGAIARAVLEVQRTVAGGDTPRIVNG